MYIDSLIGLSKFIEEYNQIIFLDWLGIICFFKVNKILFIHMDAKNSVMLHLIIK